MKKIKLLAFFACCSSALFSQNTVSATYTAGDIPTSYNFLNQAIYDNSCNGPSSVLSVALPAGDNYTVTSVQVAYTMTALNPANKSEQRSKIVFENTGASEAGEFSGRGETGVQAYSRSLSIANGSYPGGTVLTFQMKARRTVEVIAGCNIVNRVDNGSWTITVNYGNEQRNPKVGINNSQPKAAMDVNGKIKLANDTDPPQAGMVRYNAATSDFEGYNGTSWVSFTQKSNTEGWGDHTVKENQQASAPELTTNPHYGWDVSISGNYAIVGAYASKVGDNMGRGKAYIFFKTNNVWQVQDTLTPGDSDGDHFGISVSISGDYVIIGAEYTTIGANEQQGKVYIFKRNGTDWVQQSAIIANDGQEYDNYGYDVSISGDYAIVGMNASKTVSHPALGRVYIYKRTASSWLLQTKITASDGAVDDFFGTNVHISGDYLIAGDEYKNSIQGKAYIFKRTGITWAEQASFTLSDGDIQDQAYFGGSVSIDGDYAVVGARFKNVGVNVNQGKVYIFKRSGTAWAEEATITANDGLANDYFGGSLSIAGDEMVVGSYFANLQQGKAYIFKRSGTAWVQQAVISSSDSEAGDNFGGAVGISGNSIIVGASQKTIGGVKLQGKVYFFNK